jgi:hypothetical protein
VTGAHHPHHAADLCQVGPKCRAGAGVLDLHGYGSAVSPNRAVHLPDGRSRSRGVIELQKACPPSRADLLFEDFVHAICRQGWGRVLQLGQRGSVRRGQLLGDCCLEHRHGLAELHGSTLELAQDAEHVLGGAQLNLGRDHLGGLAADPLADAPGGASGKADGKAGEAGSTGDCAPWKIGHPAIVGDVEDSGHVQPHSGCNAIRRVTAAACG